MHLGVKKIGRHSTKNQKDQICLKKIRALIIEIVFKFTTTFRNSIRIYSLIRIN